MDVGALASQTVMNVVRALVEGLAVAVAAVFITKRKLDVNEIVGLAITAAVVFLVLDSRLLSPVYGAAVRQGAGFGMGANLVKFPMRA